MQPPHPDPVASPRAREIIRAAIAGLLRESEDLFAAIDAAVLATQSRATLRDPELADAIRASSRSNLAHWATSNLAAPGQRVPVNPAPEPTALAKLIAQRGLEDTSQAAYGAGQNAAWPFWMRAVFAMTSDTEELKEVLEISAWSIFSFVDAMVAALQEAIEVERGHALSSANSRRLMLVRELLDRRPLSVGREGQELRYPIDIFSHTAVVIWSERPDERLLELPERLADAVRAHLRRRPLTVMATPDTVWAWFPSEVHNRALDMELRRVAAPPKGVRIAIGATERAYHGFQSTHADAVMTRRLMRAGSRDVSVAAYNEIALMAITSGEPERAARYSRRLLGTLVLADAEVVETLRIYLQNRASPSRTAKAMFTHRNTIIDRIRRAEQHLAVPIEGHELELGVALELRHWFTNPGWSRLIRGEGDQDPPERV